MNEKELTVRLMEIASTSGEEEAIGYWLRDHLVGLGWTVELQAVGDAASDGNKNADGINTDADVRTEDAGESVGGRQNNVIAYLNETPRVWFSTHMDTVPPYIAPSEDDEKIYGRGACDAKGIIAAQITAAEELRKQGVTDIGLLYTVEEERASTGAKAANLHPLAAKCEYLINGEPTDNDLAIGSKGSFRFVIRAKGRAAHSAYPEEGDSAIERLLDVLADIRAADFPVDDFFGETTVNIGLIEGGAALNIIPANAEAGFLVRLTTSRKEVEAILEKIIDGRAELEVLSCSEPMKMVDVDGFNKKVVRFTTDIPHLPNWKNPLLLGPGSILVAHTKDEFVLKSDLEKAVELYVDLVRKLLTT